MGLILALPLKLLRFLVTGNMRGLVTFLLGLALLGALWEFTLVNVSSQATATGLMTQVGVEIVNPVLESHSFGLSQTVYATLEKQAAAHPTQTFTVPGLKVGVLGSAIAGKTFDQATTTYYSAVADAFYTGGANAVVASPAVLGEIANLPLLPQGQSLAGTASQLPSIPLPVSGLGLSINLLTADGHSQAQTLALWFGAASALLLGLLMLLSRGWGRLSRPGAALIGASLPGAVGVGIVWYIVSQNAAQFSPFSALLDLLAGAVVPTYVGAFAVGVLAVLVAIVGKVMFKTAKVGAAVAREGVAVGSAVVGSARDRSRGGAPGTPDSRYPAPAYGQGRGQPYPPEYPPAAPAWPNPPADPYGPTSPYGPTAPYGQPPAPDTGYPPTGQENPPYGTSARPAPRGYTDGYSERYPRGYSNGAPPPSGAPEPPRELPRRAPQWDAPENWPPTSR